MNVTIFSDTLKSHEFQSWSDQLVVSSAGQSGRMSNKRARKEQSAFSPLALLCLSRGWGIDERAFGNGGSKVGGLAHSEHRFPAPSSRLCQNWLWQWRSTLYLRETVHPRCRRPPKVLGTTKTFCFCFCLIYYLLLTRWNCSPAVLLLL